MYHWLEVAQYVREVLACHAACAMSERLQWWKFVTEKLTFNKINQTQITEDYQKPCADATAKINTCILYMIT